MRPRPLRSVVVPLLLTFAVPAVAQDTGAAQAPARPLSDLELARMTGKFLLPNGVEVALTVTSDTMVNGQPVLRTVLTVDRSSQVQVFGRPVGAAPIPATTSGPTSGGSGATGVTVAFDRQSGLQTITPTYGAAPTVTVNAASPAAAAPAGLTALPLAVGAAPVTTADGAVSLQAVRNGTQVTLAGDRLTVADLVGASVATAVVNSANDRVLDTVTTVAVDLHNAAPYQIGSAQMRVDALVVDAMRGLPR